MKTKRNDPRFYVRHLPHIQPANGVFFVTTRLAGSLPLEVVERLKEEYERQQFEILCSGLVEPELSVAKRNCFENYFGKFDQFLDSHSDGPTWLQEEEIAQIVKKAFLFFDDVRYKVVCFTIMPNHAHLVLYRLDRVLFRVMQSLKRYSGREANKVLNRTGNTFWQDESFDRLIRNMDEFSYRVNYTLNNPVKAGLCRHWWDWPHNYIRPGFEKYITRRSGF